MPIPTSEQRRRFGEAIETSSRTLGIGGIYHNRLPSGSVSST
jgi:hypothetical protein